MTDGRRFRFAPRPGPTLLTVAAAALFATLGMWQLGRAAGKRALAADFAAAGPALPLTRAVGDAPRYQRVTARGHYDADHQFLLDNRIRDGVAGVEVLTPLVLADGSAILVNRGWLPIAPDRARLPDVSVPAEERSVIGRLDALPRPGIELASPPPSGWPRLVSFPKMPELAGMLRRTLRDEQILLDASDPDGYAREWRPPGTTAERHLGYAVQWFAFAATAVAIWIAVGLRRAGEAA